MDVPATFPRPCGGGAACGKLDNICRRPFVEEGLSCLASSDPGGFHASDYKACMQSPSQFVRRGARKAGTLCAAEAKTLI